MERKYIIKFNAPHAIGYQVRIPKFKDGLPSYKLGQVNKFFRKKTTWKSALTAAKRWRNKFLKDNKISLYSERVRKGTYDNSKRNTSGIIGVSETYTIKANGYYYSGYTGTYCIDNKQYKKTFSTMLYGEREAFKMACAVRYKHSGVLIITDKKAIPCMPDVEYIIKGKQ